MLRAQSCDSSDEGSILYTNLRSSDSKDSTYEDSRLVGRQYDEADTGIQAHALPLLGKHLTEYYVELVN
jgi:hypothetical protein